MEKDDLYDNLEKVLAKCTNEYLMSHNIHDLYMDDKKKVTVRFTVVTVISINILSFSLALLLTKGLKGTNIFRTIFFMPNLIGGVVLGYIWQIIINCVLSLVDEPLLALNTTAGYWGLIILM